MAWLERANLGSILTASLACAPAAPTTQPAPEPATASSAPEPAASTVATRTPPPVDTDGDGLVDELDACPELPEDFDEDADEDGCPDLLCTLGLCSIALLEKVHFAYDRSSLDPRSHQLLDDVAFLLTSFPDYTFAVGGHTDSEGSSAYNRELSQARVESVIAYLIAKGIAADRLAPAAYGEDMPIDTNKTREGRAHNRRVEFHRTDGECAD